MSARNKEVVPGARAPVLSRALLARTHELNGDYVELMLEERALLPHGMVAEALPVKVLDALESLTAAARHAVAACPFALYTLGFDDIRFWNAALDDSSMRSSGTSFEARYGVLSCAPMQAAFCELAVFLAWHTSQSQPFAARLLFGMPDAIIALFAVAPLWQIRRVASDFPGLLAPRWPRNAAFWPDLIRFAGTSDARLESTRLLGNQLIASDLDGTLPRNARQQVRLRTKRKTK